MMNKYLLSIILMSAATQIPRLVPAVSKMSQIKNRNVNRFLKSVPLAALGALIFPGVLNVGNSALIGIIAGIFSIILAVKKINIMVNIVLSSVLTSTLIYITSII